MISVQMFLSFCTHFGGVIFAESRAVTRKSTHRVRGEMGVLSSLLPASPLSLSVNVFIFIC